MVFEFNEDATKGLLGSLICVHVVPWMRCLTCYSEYIDSNSTLIEVYEEMVAGFDIIGDAMDICTNDCKNLTIRNPS